MSYNRTRVYQTVAYKIRKDLYEESPSSIEQGCQLTAGVGNHKESATEKKTAFKGKDEKVG